VRYEHAKLLLEFARLQLAIALSRNPSAAMDVTEATLTGTPGYRKLRAWFAGLSPRKRDAGALYMREQMKGIRDVMALARKTGEKLSLADIEISTFDESTREPLPEPIQTGGEE
jgi:hypothetical protein